MEHELEGEVFNARRSVRDVLQQSRQQVMRADARVLTVI